MIGGDGGSKEVDDWDNYLYLERPDPCLIVVTGLTRRKGFSSFKPNFYFITATSWKYSYFLLYSYSVKCHISLSI